MSIEFNRRTFLKTSAALAGAVALVGLTGCDSSSSSHPINKSVDFNKTYEVDAVGVKLELPIGSSTGAYGSSVTATFTISNLSDAPVTLGMDSLSATYKGTALQSPSFTYIDGAPLTGKSLTLQKKGTDGQDFVSFQVAFKLPDAKASIDDVIFRLHYGKKSIRFQSRNGTSYTSGVYKD